MTCQHADTHLADAIKDRGRLYLTTYRELSKRFGEAEATSVMRSVSGALGREVGRSLAHNAPRDFAGMLEGYFKAPDDGATFNPEVRRLDETGLEVRMMSCPLKQSWVEAGCGDDEVCALLHCASAFDEAVMETAGFAFELELWSPGKQGCCRTRLTEKSRA